MKKIWTLLFFYASIVSAQKIDYSVSLIDADLKENANAIVRSDDVLVTITSQRAMNIKTKRVVTVVNEFGVNDIDTYEHYDNTRKIKGIEMTIVDGAGKVLKTFKKRDFKDISVGDGSSFYDDNRALVLDYTPTQYPFTAIFESEVETSNTAFIRPWTPLDGYYISTEKSVVTIKFQPELGFKFKESNFAPKYNIEKVESAGFFQYSASKIKAIKNENSSPSFLKIAPVAYFKVEKFNLEGVDGEVRSWSDFGKWYYDNLLVGSDALPVETQNTIKLLVGDEKDPLKIARIVYKYVQDKTRYVSIQVGIGGFKPMPATSVDKLGYGDCKALTNYTRSLLNVVGVPSYYTVVNGDEYNRMDMQEDFVSLQGNHIILAIPDKDKLVWLECTSQTQPFGFQGTFTDDRKVLLVKPEGGEIVRTQSFLNKGNSQKSIGNYILSSDGNLKGSVKIISEGSQYDNSFKRERFNEEQKQSYYKSYFGNIHNLKIEKVKFKNDLDNIRFTQEIEMSAQTYASTSNDRLMFVLNAFNINDNTPKRYRNRENPFEVNRGYEDYDEITVSIPEGYTVEALPQDFSLSTKFGEYKTEVVKSNATTLVYRRTLYLKDGLYENKDYDDYRLFREQLSKNDNAKVILVKQ